MQTDWNERKPSWGLFRTPTWASFRLFRNTSIIGRHDVMWKRSTQWKALITKDIKKTARTHSLTQSNASPFKGCLYDTWMTFIPASCRFHSEYHSHDKTEGLSMVFAYAPVASDYNICDTQSGTKFVFRMKFRTRTWISFGMKTGMA